MDERRVLTRNEVDKLLVDVLDEHNIIDPRIEISSGSNKGDGYLSFITRVAITGRNKNLGLVIKCAPIGEKIRLMVPIHSAYQREIIMYDKVFPMFSKFQESVGAEKQFKGFVKCYKYVSTRDEEKLVLEDIKGAGFGLWDRRKQMSEEMVKFVIEQYAQYHGISYALKDQRPEQYDEVANRMTNGWTELFRSDSETVNSAVREFNYVCKIIQSNEDESVYKAVVNYSEVILKYYTNEREKGKFTVISHGDCWCNNMMFKFGDNANPTKPTEIKLLDFQLSDDTSPAYDLAYFLYVSAPKSVLDNLEDFLKIYYENLTSFTKSLGTDLSKYLTFEELMEQWKPASKFGFNLFILIIKALCQENSEVLDLHDITSGRVDMETLNERKMINEEQIEQRIRDLSLHMYHRGYFLE